MTMTGKRAALAAFDFTGAIAVALAALPVFSTPAYAYVDPSVMTYTIQALAGVAVALSTVLGVAFRKTRKKLMRTLGIDENAGKEIDARWFRVGEGVAPDVEVDAAPAAKARSRKRDRRPDDERGDAPRWRRRFALSLLVSAFCGLTLGIVAPFEIVAGSAESLLFSLDDIWPLMSAFTAACVLALALLLSLVRGRAFTFLLVLLFCGGLCCYVQAMFLNTGLPLANGATVDYWSEHGTMMVVSTVVWVLLLAVPPFFARMNRGAAQGIVGLAAVALIVVQGVGVGSLFASPKADASLDPNAGKPVYVTEDGLFEVSSKSNVIVFVLDRFDTQVMNQLVSDVPDIFDGMDGFTYYDNQAGVMIPTLYAVPNLLTGEVPQPGESIADYEVQRYVRGDFLEEIKALGYSTGLYSDTLQLGLLDDETMHREVADLTMNIHALDNFSLDKKGTLSALVKCALYRDMPWVLKWRFWFYTDEVNQKAVSYSADDAPESTAYAMDDEKYYERLKQFGLTVHDEEDAPAGSFKFIHLAGAHDPYGIDENGQFVGIGNSTEERQAQGSLRMVKDYLQDLKDLGLYDDATIIVTSDHGRWFSSLEQPEEPISPFLLVKPSGSGEGDGVSVSHSAVSHVDFQGTVLAAMGGESSKYGTTYFDEFPDDRSRPFYMITSDGRYAIDIYEYDVVGDVLDMDNWRLTGETWHANDVGA